MDTQMYKGWLHRKSFRVYQAGYKPQLTPHNYIIKPVYLNVFTIIYIFIHPACCARAHLPDTGVSQSASPAPAWPG
jgi:hypothetical protein